MQGGVRNGVMQLLILNSLYRNSSFSCWRLKIHIAALNADCGPFHNYSTVSEELFALSACNNIFDQKGSPRGERENGQGYAGGK